MYHTSLLTPASPRTSGPTKNAALKSTQLILVKQSQRGPYNYRLVCVLSYKRPLPLSPASGPFVFVAMDILKRL